MIGGRHAGPSEHEVRAIAAMRRQAKVMKKNGLKPDEDAIKLIHELAKRADYYRKDEQLERRAYV